VVKTVSGNWLINGIKTPVVIIGDGRSARRRHCCGAALLPGRQQIVSKDGAGYQRRFSRWVALSKLTLSGTRNSSGRWHGDGRAIFSFVSLCDPLRFDPSYFSKGCRPVELTTAAPAKKSSSFKQSVDLISPHYNSTRNKSLRFGNWP